MPTTVRDPPLPLAPWISQFGADPNRASGGALECLPWSSLREIPMKILVNVSALFLSMILALIPFAVIAVNDSAAFVTDHL